MTTLKSALRFPQHPPPPPPLPQQYPTLTSRFSAETLVIKSPPRAAIQRIFSTSNRSPPTSPRRRSQSYGGGRLGHAAAASESRINIASPKPYELEEGEEPAGRASFDHYVSRPVVSPTSGGRSRSRPRAPSGTAADKLADAAQEVIAKLTLRRGRQPSNGSERSVESLLSSAASSGRKSSESARSHHRRSRRSLSSPSPVPAEVIHSTSSTSRPVPPSRRPPPPPRPSTPPFKLTDLPPRSDSRNAITGQVDFSSPSKPPTRRAPPPPALKLPAAVKPQAPHPVPLPALAAARPRPKHRPLAAVAATSGPRPHAPPTPSVKPLRPARPPPNVPIEPAAESATHNPLFRALVLKAPSALAVQTKPHDELFVEIGVGGESTYTTTVATLVRDDGCGGKLAEFVEGVLSDVVAGVGAAEEVDVPDEAASMPAPTKRPLLDLPIPLPSLGVDIDDASSSISLAAPSPYPSSPFPFAGYASSSDGCSPSQELEEDPLSPVDPFVSGEGGGKSFLALPPTFARPAPPLPSPPTQQVHAAKQQVQVVPSPTFESGGKHRSVHPSFGGIVGTVELPPSPPPSLPSLPSSSSSSPTPPSPGTLARQALAARRQQAHFSLSSSSTSSFSLSRDKEDEDDDEDDVPDTALLQPFFSVLRDQLHAPSPSSPSGISPSSPITAAAFSALARDSLSYGLDGLPSDVEGYEAEEDRSRSTVLGVPRGVSGASWAVWTGEDAAEREREDVPEVPALPDFVVEAGEKAVEEKEEDVRPESPTRELTADDCTLTLFLDRSDLPLSSAFSNDVDGAPYASPLSTYSALLHFLRTSTLPASLTLPRSAPSSARDPLSLSLDLDPLTLSLLRLHPAPLFALFGGLRTLAAEARWLGMLRLEVACEEEMGRARAVVELLTREKERDEERPRRNREKSREEVVQERARAGWI